MIFVSPTEPKELHTLGTLSMVTEENGVDILWTTAHGKVVGVQRKKFPSDFLASVFDGRLNKEVAQMQQLDRGILVIEGQQRWTTEGRLLSNGSEGRSRTGWTKEQHRRYLYTIRDAGIWVEDSRSIQDTISVVSDLRVWFDKERHNNHLGRPGPQKKAPWAHITNRDYQKHLLQGLPQIGPELAERILEQLGMPFHLGVTREQLMGIRGIGKTLADKICKVFEERVVEVE
jgi:ERCC4-type nuclease